MPTTTIGTVLSAAGAAATGHHKRVTITCPTASVTLPDTDPEVEYLDLGTWQWKELPRTGQVSLLRRTGVSRARIRLKATLRKIGSSSTPEKQIAALIKIANQGAPVAVAYGEWIAARKWIINGSPTVTSKRLWEGTNKIMHADVTIELIQWVEEGVTKPAAATRHTSGTTSSSGRRSSKVQYTVRPGDTLTGIAARVTGNAANYRRIAAENHIRNPNRLTAGQRLTITL